MTNTYCPHCLNEIDERDTTCCSCGEMIEQHGGVVYMKNDNFFWIVLGVLFLLMMWFFL